MSYNNNFQNSQVSGIGIHIPFFPTVQTPASFPFKKITHSKWNKMCEVIPYGKKGTLAKYGTNAKELGLRMFNEWLDASNGGTVEAKISQSKWMEEKINGKTTSPNTINNLIDAFIEGLLTVKTKQAEKKDKNKDFNLYIGGPNLRQWIDETVIAQKRIDDRLASFDEELRKLNIDPYKPVGCDCCHRIYKARHFGKNQIPVCKNCWKNDYKLALKASQDYGRNRAIKENIENDLIEEPEIMNEETPEPVVEHDEKELKLIGNVINKYNDVFYHDRIKALHLDPLATKQCSNCNQDVPNYLYSITSNKTLNTRCRICYALEDTEETPPMDDEAKKFLINYNANRKETISARSVRILGEQIKAEGKLDWRKQWDIDHPNQESFEDMLKRMNK